MAQGKKRVYSRRNGSDTWHWLCRVASRPLESDLVKVGLRPKTGDLCNTCKAIERRLKKFQKG